MPATSICPTWARTPPRPTSGATRTSTWPRVFDKTEAVATVMDELGYYALWLAEHHFQHEGYECPPEHPDVGGAPGARHQAVNDRLRLQHRAHVASAPAGRGLRRRRTSSPGDATIFGVGRGYHTREVETFGAPMLDADANRELFEEQVEIIMQGLHAGVLLAPGQALHAAARRCPIAATSCASSRSCRARSTAVRVLAADRERGRARARLHGQARHQGRDRRRRRHDGREARSHGYRDAAARAGTKLALGEDLCLGIFYHLADSRERAIREITPFYEEHVKMFGPLGFVPGITPGAARSLHEARRLGRRRRADRGALHEVGRVVRRAARRS